MCVVSCMLPLFKLRNQSRSSISVNALYGLCLGGSSLATKSGHSVSITSRISGVIAEMLSSWRRMSYRSRSVRSRPSIQCALSLRCLPSVCWLAALRLDRYSNLSASCRKSRATAATRSAADALPCEISTRLMTGWGQTRPSDDPPNDRFGPP
jgi:hypothetical protein